MSTGPGGKPDAGSQAGRPDTGPNRLVIRAGAIEDSTDSTVLGSNDTAVAGKSGSGSQPGAKLGLGPTVGDTQVAASDPATTAELVGTTLSARYLVTRKVGQGGMGAVYEATDIKIGKQIAVKVLLEKYAKREPIVQRLVQEARLASSCRNEHIIDFNDFGTTDDGRTFVVMEYLEGESLAELLARETPLPEQRLLRIVAQAASALVAAHAMGIVHRDIKPENLFLLRRNDQDFVKVVDFGISKSLRASDEAEDQPRLTQTGMVLGTPLYMSPEQARGDDELDARVDVYALGVIMYEAATGQVPFSGTNYLSVISQVLNEDPRPPRELRPELSEELEAVILRAMTKARDDRYASADELLADVTALLTDPTRSTERARITAPRKKPAPPSKSPLKIAVWVALITVVIAAVVTTVVMLFSGGEVIKERVERNKVIADPRRVIDAGVIEPPDASPPPEAETIEVTIKTDPVGAEIQVDGIDKGRAPVAVKLVIHDHFTEIVASLAGYEDKKITFNTYVNRDQLYNIKLKKLPRPAPQPPAPHHAPSGSGDKVKPDITGGDLSGNPFAKGSGKPSP
jgi:serine/threonine protein kinase